MDKKIYRSKTDKKIAGVCGGLAKLLDIDATLIRLIWALTVALGGSGVVAYIVCAIVIPEEPEE